MTDTTPLTDMRLDEIEVAIAAYRQHAPTGFACCTAHPVADEGAALVAEIRRLRDELARRTEDLAFLERTTLPELRREVEHHKDGKQRWRDRAEKAGARVAELETYANGCDAEGCVLPHSSWCERAQKAAAENDGCTCGQPWTGHPQPHAMHCWTVNPPRAEVEEMRRTLAEARTKTLSTEADEIVAHCPDHGSKDGV